jgi:hypothetical protein
LDYVDLNEEIERHRDGDWGKAMQIAEMQDAFPDLKLFRDHWGQIKFCSAAANDQVDTIEMDSCHNCDGKPIKLWTYVVVAPDGTRLYSDPPVFVVADQNQQGFGEIPRDGWEEELKEAGISRFVTQKVRDHLRGHPPINYFEDDDSGQGGDQGGDQGGA